MGMYTVAEQTTLGLTIAFYDENDDAMTPTTAAYTIHDVESGAVILPSTSISSLSTSVTVTVTAAQNRILSARPKEEHCLTLTWTYSGGAKTAHDEYRWLVKQLPFLT